MIDVDSGKSQTVLHTAPHTLMCLIALVPPLYQVGERLPSARDRVGSPQGEPSVIITKKMCTSVRSRAIVCPSCLAYSRSETLFICRPTEPQSNLNSWWQITVDICLQRSHSSFQQTDAQGGALYAKSVCVRELFWRGGKKSTSLQTQIKRWIKLFSVTISTSHGVIIPP